MAHRAARRAAAAGRCEELEATVERLRAWLALLAGGHQLLAFQLDAEGRVTDVTAVGQLSSDPEALLGTHFSTYFPSDENPGVAALFERLMSGEELPPLHLVARTLAGGTLPVEISARPVIVDGTPVGAYVVARDDAALHRSLDGQRRYQEHLEHLLADRTDELRRSREREAEEALKRRAVRTALRQSEQRFRAAVEMADQGVACVDEKTIVTYVSERAAALLGFRPEEMLGRSAYDFVAPEDIDVAWAEREKAVRGERRRRTFSLVGKDGTARRLWAPVFPLKDATGAYAGSVVMLMPAEEHGGDLPVAARHALVEIEAVLAARAHLPGLRQAAEALRAALEPDG